MDNDTLRFYVKDNGVGMDEAFMKKAFMPFQRINNREREGTGIGLAICKKVADLHQGEIWYESKLMQGTTFYFSVPVTSNQPPMATPDNVVTLLAR